MSVSASGQPTVKTSEQIRVSKAAIFEKHDEIIAEAVQAGSNLRDSLKQFKEERNGFWSVLNTS